VRRLPTLATEVFSRLGAIVGRVAVLIQELAKEDSLNVLAHMHLGRLGCANGSQPYVVPFYFAYADNYLYSFATVGQKIEWMRANPLVCVETDRIATAEEWVSIIITGRYEELPDTPEWKAERERAYLLLQQKANWWQPGYAKTILHGTERPLVPIFFRIRIAGISGRHGASDSPPPNDANSSMVEHASKQSIQDILQALRKRLFSK
jgi:nitroimidazol reductase NimA-like FMN-containing flavoprotein (pyridoxamine 5'-phosphate oxidase superfamily)